MRPVGVAILAMVLVGVVAGAASSAPPHERYLITLQGPPETAREAVARGVERSGGKVLHAFDMIPVVAIEVPGPALQGLINNPNLKGVVQLVEEDAVVTATKKPDNPGGGKPGGGKPPKPPEEEPAETLEWGVDRIDADLALAAGHVGAGVKVCVIDTGIDKDHPDLVGNVKGGINFVWQKGKIRPGAWDDDNGHGTHVAGVIAAVDNEIGVIGVAPKASLYAAKALDRKGSGYVSDVIAAIQWAVSNDIQVVNMSLSTAVHIEALQTACDAACAQGVTVVASAGNSGDGSVETDEVQYPAAYASVVAVAATASGDSVPSWSSSGPQVELAAPGVSVRSTYKKGGYETLSGTSMAAPHVSGTAALVRGAGAISPADLRARLAATAEDIGADVRLAGNGLVDAESASQ